MKLTDIYQTYLEDLDLLLSDQDAAIGIEDTKIPGEQRKQPEVYLHWGRLHAMAENEHDYQDEYIKTVVWPQAKERARNQLELMGYKKPTIDAQEELARQDEEYRRHSAKRLKIKALTRFLSKMENALMMRGNLLQSIGAYQREELKSIPRDLDTLKDVARQSIARSRNL
jgi:hypothetical protein